MNVALVIQLVLLLTVANVTPVIVKRIFGTWADRAIDGGMRLADGRFVFGSSKTIRGIVSSVIATGLTAAGLSLTLYTGFIIALGAMAGDLTSSFIKRRLGLEPGSKATGLDQVPESLLPSLFASTILPLTAGDIAAIVLIFFCGEVLFARVFFWAGVRDRPY